VETEANMVLAGHERLVSIAHAGLGLIGQKRNEKCLLLFGATGSRATVRQGKHGAITIARRYGGFHTGQYMGKVWEKSRYRTPYLRNSLWKLGCAIDTLETIVPWADVLATAQAIIEALLGALDDTGERVFVFAHLSHLYPTGASIYVTYLFRARPDPDQQIEYWQRMKRAASQAVVAHGGSISHQHGVGIDHAPYLEAEKGKLGMEIIAGVMRQCDPDGILNPGKLIKTVMSDG
jgi:alkyldihydroxyacetonephosphate synthase